MNTFEKVLDIPGAATVMGSKIIGRVIGQVANGYGEDEVLVDELCLFKAIEAKYPKDTISMPAMFKSMVRRASKEVVADERIVARVVVAERQPKADHPPGDGTQRHVENVLEQNVG